MKIFYFTATGNSLYVAKKIGGELYSIPRLLKENRFEFEDEAIGIVFPCYSLGVPSIVKDFLSKAKLKADYFFSVMTYGNIAAAGLKTLENTAAKSGIKFNYTNEILMIDNFLPIFDMEKQIKDEEKKNIEPNLYLIVNDIKNRKNNLVKKSLPVNLLSKAVSAVFKQKPDSDKKFIVNDNCTKCAICQKVCPAGNIEVSDKPKYLHKCAFCMACIQLCPENAIHLKSEKSAARFKNSHIELKEIISANNQI